MSLSGDPAGPPGLYEKVGDRVMNIKKRTGRRVIALSFVGFAIGFFAYRIVVDWSCIKCGLLTGLAVAAGGWVVYFLAPFVLRGFQKKE